MSHYLSVLVDLVRAQVPSESNHRPIIFIVSVFIDLVIVKHLYTCMYICKSVEMLCLCAKIWMYIVTRRQFSALTCQIPLLHLQLYMYVCIVERLLTDCQIVEAFYILVCCYEFVLRTTPGFQLNTPYGMWNN